MPSLRSPEGFEGQRSLEGSVGLEDQRGLWSPGISQGSQGEQVQWVLQSPQSVNFEKMVSFSEI